MGLNRTHTKNNKTAANRNTGFDCVESRWAIFFSCFKTVQYKSKYKNLILLRMKKVLI